MDKKNKALLITILTLVVLLFCAVFYASFQIASIQTNYDNLAESVKNIKVIDGVDGNDGKDGKNGIGINGLDGKNGVDSLSTHTIETYYVHPPAEKGEKGADGEKGKDAPIQEIQINPETKDLQIKKSTDRYWTTLIPCSELLKQCPDVVIGIGDE